jgi:hypothetical protein
MSRFTLSDGVGRTLLAAVLAAALYLGIAGHFVRHGMINFDEGFYAYVARDVMRGRLPYRDFAYTQTPLLPYLQGAAMSVTGYGVREQRWINAAVGALALALGLLMWRRQGVRQGHCLVLALVWCLCVPLLYYDTIGKTYAWAQLWLVVAAAAFFWPVRPLGKLALFSVAGVLAVGCRLTVLPAVLGLGVGLVVLEKQRLSWTLLIAVPVLAALSMLGPFFAADPANASFWGLYYHFWYHSQSALPSQHLDSLWQSIVMVPGIAVLAVVALAGAWRNPREPGSWILWAGLAGWVLSAGLPDVYTDYAIPCLPLVIIGSGGLFRPRAYSSRAMTVGFPVVLLAVTAGRLFIPLHDIFLDGYLDAVDRTGAYVRNHTRPEDLVLTPMPEIALAAHRNVPAGLELGKFGVTVEMDAPTALRRHILTMEHLRELIGSERAPVVVLCRFRNGNFAWSVPSLRHFNGSFRRQLFETLLQHYGCTYLDDHFLVFERRMPGEKYHPIDPAEL